MIMISLLISFQAYATYNKEAEEEEKLPTVNKLVEENYTKIQMVKGPDDTLEAVLGTGPNVLLKLSLDTRNKEFHIGKEHLQVPVRLFLTDFRAIPTSDPMAHSAVEIDCEVTTPLYTLPPQPNFFKNYVQFEEWLKKAYFTNQMNIAYDFTIDIQALAPALAERLYFVLPKYHFIGTYSIDNASIMPDKYEPTVSYHSSRGTINTTTAILGCNFYIKKKPYSINPIKQIFPHPIIEEKVFETDPTKKFYSREWIAQSEQTVKVTYGEFPKDQIKNWPTAPQEIYCLVQQRPGDLENIDHLSCLDGSSGEEIDINSKGKVFPVISQAKADEYDKFQECIIKDEAGHFYITHYVHKIENEKVKILLSQIESDLQKINSCTQEKLASIKHAEDYRNKYGRSGWITTCYISSSWSDNKYDDPNGKTYYTQPSEHKARYESYLKDSNQHEDARKMLIPIVRVKMAKYQALTGKQHPRWAEFSGN